jgi:hypothetical protein
MFMACIHCGQDGETAPYVFQFGSDPGESTNVKLRVCDVCREVLRTDDDVESVRPIARSR